MSPEDGESAGSGASGQPSVRRRALGGVLSLAGRDIALKVLAFAGWIILARLLDPATFGLFAVASFTLSVFALFSQLGQGLFGLGQLGALLVDYRRRGLVDEAGVGQLAADALYLALQAGNFLVQARQLGILVDQPGHRHQHAHLADQGDGGQRLALLGAQYAHRFQLGQLGQQWLEVAQAAAILPGISRSGSTIAAGLGVGLTRTSAVSYSFLLAIPALAGAGLLEGLSIYSKGSPAVPLAWLAIGGGVSLAVGLAALWSLERVLARGWLPWFGWYCITLGLAVTAWQIVSLA